MNSVSLPHIIVVYILLQIFECLMMRYLWIPIFTLLEPPIKKLFKGKLFRGNPTPGHP